MKVCSTCKLNKIESEFSKNSKKKDGLQTFCRQCSSIKNREYYLDNHESQLKKKGERRERIKQEARDYVLDYWLTHPCVDCGEPDPIVLEFDHISGNKINSISNMIKNAESLEKIKAEIDKCVVRCANCHKRKTAKDFKWRKAKSTNDMI